VSHRSSGSTAEPSTAAATAPTSTTRPWSTSTQIDQGGLEIGGISADELARTFGTPVMAIDEDDVRERARAFRVAFGSALYSVKALTARRLIRLVADEGLGALAASGGELRAALEAGVPPERIALHGNNKSDDELRLAVTERIGLVIVDNPAELERLASIADDAGATQPILFRVIPSVTAGGHPSIETGGEDSKFGMTPEEALTAIRRATELPSVAAVGLHTHVGSQIEGVAPFLSAIDVLIEVARASKGTRAALTRFDVGGGFAATYVDEAPADLVAIAREVTERLRTGLQRHGLPPGELIVEPGRAIVANAGITLYRVGAVKERGGRVLAAVDGGMSDNIRPALYGSRYTVALASAAPGRPVRTVDVVGKHCESGDVIARGCELSEPRPGDLLAVAATGAYCYSMASNYNQAGRPPLVAVRNGTATPWLRRETFDDLRALEVDEAVRLSESS
jgi:diaminopimelate decarboxylase